MISLALLLTGCAKVSHLDQLLTLKDLAGEQAAINRDIKKQDANFDRMREEAKAGTLERYSSKRKILKEFGEPVYTRAVEQDGGQIEAWLYRHATEYFGTDKVYLYFDVQGKLVRSEYIEGTDHGQSEQETATENGREEI